MYTAGNVHGAQRTSEEGLKMTKMSNDVKSNVVREHRAVKLEHQDAKRMRDEEKWPSSDEERGSTSDVLVLGRECPKLGGQRQQASRCSLLGGLTYAHTAQSERVE